MSSSANTIGKDDKNSVAELFRLLRAESNDDENDMSWQTLLRQVDVNCIDEDQEEKPSLLIAAVCYKPDWIEFILQEGCNVNYQDSNGMTALHWLCCCYHLEYCASFRSVDGIMFDAKDKNGRTALHLLYEFGLMNAVQVHRSDSQFNQAVTFFMERRADINCQDNDGNTPLHRAIVTSIPFTFFDKFLCLQVIEKLLTEWNARYDIPNNENKTAWEMATELDMSRVVDTIMEIQLPKRIQVYSFIYEYWFSHGFNQSEVRSNTVANLGIKRPLENDEENASNEKPDV